MAALPCTSGAATVERIDPADLPVSLAIEWDELADAAAEPNSFAERWFVEAGVRHLPRPKSLTAFAVRLTGDRLDAIFLLHKDGRYGRWPLAAWQNWLHHHQFLGLPLIRKDMETDAWQALFKHLDATPGAPPAYYFSEMPHGASATQALLSLKRKPVIVHTYSRALMKWGRTPEGYWEAAVRKKKRKEIGRLEKRLDDIGPVRCERSTGADDISEWIDAFLALEASGWKGERGSALARGGATQAFFRDALAEALARGRAEMLRLKVADQTIAMLVNFLAPPGAFSFKIAYDEAFARYSPGVLIEKANLTKLNDPAFAWMDSCAVENHPMINSLWMERRDMVRVALARRGWRARLAFGAARSAEILWGNIKSLSSSGGADKQGE
mgnify:CR=1 FL=1|jgi:CelD/BcsL family acetyltransferase involved in cellulose biosynthesis